MVCFILNKEIINKNKAAASIDGPEGVLNSNDENRPIKTDNNPPIIEKIIIFLGLSEMISSHSSWNN